MRKRADTGGIPTGKDAVGAGSSEDAIHITDVETLDESVNTTRYLRIWGKDAGPPALYGHSGG